MTRIVATARRRPTVPTSFDTHEVFNQTPPFADVNLAALDAPLLDALAANGIDPISGGLLSFGETWGTGEQLDLGRIANENPPRLRTFDPRGFRADVVEFHPAYHALMQASVEAGLHASTWDGESGEHAAGHGRSHVARSARHFIVAQVESGHLCPITMTHASVAALAAAPERLRDWLPLVRSRQYDPRFLPFWEKRGVTLGMGMTEKQGGTDVRANTTRAEATGSDEYEITGHKWFMSAPMCDAFLVLAQAAGGLTCFLVPRFRPDGNVNALRFQRLKDKLGNRSNASSEVEFTGAFAWRVGEEGKGVRTIIEMVQLTRLDCVSGSAGLARMALALAVHNARHRSVFRRKLVDQPAMRAVLADLALEVEATTALTLRLARSFDLAGTDRSEAARARVLTPAAKFIVCKAAPGLVYEAMECLGGNGYVEESPLPRIFREAPVNAIWEGSGNVMALDVLRAASREPEAIASVLVTLAEETRDLPGATEAVQDVETVLASGNAEAHARMATERLALLAATAALARSAPGGIAEAYARSRLLAPRRMIGANALGKLADGLIGRALPFL
ncbi:isovaleryl-CoA dehydrogenase [Chelatococcus sp. SYSU_G07232]|uniref:Isovaleryl-CoA dehydrogenase n=1 Tax=Chelatococcus albus TaxID=3047466 RepID=A0ABT7AEC6_9HYPH|nr:isovaleryl-CoA dehydrogenase [Chelatococcus sp. SYSU_G07232]MDJ1157194.1 isovaleryl-CoA dehydrogenase [Chelatococcus sp. SYSU_G07232]